MPVSWTAENDQRLLFCVLDLVTVEKTAIAKAWAARYGHEKGDQPTPRAIVEHLKTLKSKLDQGIDKQPITPKTVKAKSAKTKAGDAVRAKKRGRPEDDDDDDDDDEQKIKAETSHIPCTPESITLRTKRSRKSKTGKSFAEGLLTDDEEHEADESDGHLTAFPSKTLDDSNTTDIPLAGKKKMIPVISDSQSDISEFEPMFN